MVGFVIWLLVIGLIAGFIARALVPGRDPMGLLATILLGVVGSFVGGFLGRALFGHGTHPFGTAGIIGSIIGAIIVLLLYRLATGRRGTRYPV